MTANPMNLHKTASISRRLLLVQGLYFAITGIWPILHMASFEWVTGPKQDDWLVQTVGAMILVIGASLALASFAKVLNTANFLLAAGSAMALLVVDVVFTAAGAIRPIYLLDAALECLLLVAWLVIGIFAWRAARHAPPRNRGHLALAFQ